MRDYNRVVLAIAVWSAVLTPAVVASPLGGPDSSWRSLTYDQRLGYVNGALDCGSYYHVINLRNAPLDKNIVAMIDRVRVPIASGPFELVVRAVRASSTKDGGAETGETWTEPHAYWDGLWWKGAENPLQIQEGFVEGYLSCFKALHQKHGIVPNEPPLKYVGLVTRWYERTGNEGAKIGWVLMNQAVKTH